MAEWLEQSPGIEPVHPLKCGEFHGLQMPPRPTTTDDLGLVETNDGLGEGIVVRVASTPDGRVNLCLGAALGVANREVLPTAITVMYQRRRVVERPGIERLLQRIQHEVAAGACSTRASPRCAGRTHR